MTPEFKDILENLTETERRDALSWLWGKSSERMVPIPAPAELVVSLRDYFAGQALTGLLACPHTNNQLCSETVRRAYRTAEEMMGYRNTLEGS